MVDGSSFFGEMGRRVKLWGFDKGRVIVGVNNSVSSKVLGTDFSLLLAIVWDRGELPVNIIFFKFTRNLKGDFSLALLGDI